MDKFKCKNCKEEVTAVDPLFGFCSKCKKFQEKSYDNHVDPTGFYQSKSIENYD